MEEKDKSKKASAKKKSASVKTGTAKSTGKKTVKKTSVKQTSARSKSAKKNTQTKNAVVKKTPVKKSSAKKSIKKNSTPKKNLPASKKNEIEEVDPEALKRGDDPMSVVGHLDELRSRLLIILGTIIIFTIIGFIFSERIVNFINKPFLETGNRLNIFKLAGGFIIKLKASVGVAIFATIPLIIFHIWRFISPAIGIEEKLFSRVSVVSAIVLFYSGVSFVFFGLLPFAIKMLLAFITSDMLSTIGADDYLSFIFLFSLAMGILFELPIVILILTKVGIVTPYFLITKRKYAIITIWVIAALITPQDPLSQVLVAVPLMFLYEVSILISKLVLRRAKKKELIAKNF